MKMKTVSVQSISLSNTHPFVLIGGPCVLESEEHAMKIAKNLKAITQELAIPFIFKVSFDKANRSSMHSYRGVPLEKALPVFQNIRSQLQIPLLTDVHLPEQCPLLAPYVDVLQIPAFLCRQTDLLAAAAKTQKPVLVKKGQFMAPWDMKNILEKIEFHQNTQILLCERGTCFGYNNLVSDMRSLAIMAEEGYPVVFDATHSVQQPGGLGKSSGGERKWVPLLARSAIAVGIAALFIETHPNPEEAPSDGPNMMELDKMPSLLKELKEMDLIRKQTLHNRLKQQE